MKIQYVKNGKSAEKFETCIECGKDSYLDEHLVRLTIGSSMHHVSVCLCSSCLNRLIGELRNF